MYEIKDQLNNHINLHSKPERIISLVPSITEYLYELELGDRVVAITKFCVHPSTWFREKEIIGGTKQQHLEKIKDLQPDLIIANKEENIKSYVEKLNEICPVYVSDVDDFDSAISMMRDLGILTGEKGKSVKIIQNIIKGFHTIKTSSENLAVAYCIWKNPWMWAGSDTFISSMLSYSGFQNIIDSRRYPEIDMDEIVNNNPDLIFLSSEPYPFKDEHIAELQTKYPSAKFRIVDGEMFSWYGSRMLKAPEYFNSLFSEIESE